MRIARYYLTTSGQGTAETFAAHSPWIWVIARGYILASKRPVSPLHLTVDSSRHNGSLAWVANCHWEFVFSDTQITAADLVGLNPPGQSCAPAAGITFDSGHGWVVFGADPPPPPPPQDPFDIANSLRIG